MALGSGLMGMGNAPGKRRKEEDEIILTPYDKYVPGNTTGCLINNALRRTPSTVVVKYVDKISNELLVAIFFPDNPLHDGGVIIQGDKITSAGAIFPTTVEMRFSKRLGTRHRAAIGISEETDAIAIIVSEETGRISIAVKGDLNYNLSLEDAKAMILEELKPKKQTEFEFDELEEDGDSNEKNN